MTDDGDIFVRLLFIKLIGRLKKAQSGFASRNISLQEAEKLLNTCNAMLQQLTSYVTQHHIDPEPYREQWTAAFEAYDTLEAAIQRRRNPRWRTLISIVLRGIAMILDIIGILPPFMLPPMLPPG